MLIHIRQMIFEIILIFVAAMSVMTAILYSCRSDPAEEEIMTIMD